MTVAVSLFAGGLDGFDHAARRFGVDPLGIEWDDAACATREAAGLRTLQADVAELDPAGFGPVDLLIGTPPCQAFSTAGNGEGRRALKAYEDALHRMRDHQPVAAAELDRACGDPRGHLVLEPLRWALALKPRWVALEQVPPVLPLWEATAEVLRAHGYSTWTGVLSAERYGVPQTRRRAFLAASLTGPVSEPPPSHQRYVAPTRRDEETLGLFDAPEPERIVLPEDRGLLPWVSMAEALGWEEGLSPSPAPSVTGGGGATGGVEVFASKGARSRVARAVALQAGTNAHDVQRAADEPAPTLRFGARLNAVTWTTERPTHYDRRQASNGTPVRLIPVSEPAPTMMAQGLAGRDVWVTEGAPRRGWVTEGAVRVTLQEALILQAFPPDLPVQGSRSKQFEQVGNAVPPPLAHAVLTALGVGA